MQTIVTPIPIPRLCVVAAASIEFKAVTQQLSETIFSTDDGLNTCRGRAGRNQITVLQANIGAVGFREKLVSYLRKQACDAVVVLGLGGGLSPDLKTGETVLYDTCFVFRPEAPVEDDYENSSGCETQTSDFNLSSALRQRLMNDGCTTVFAAGLTIDFMVTTPDEKLSMGESYGAAVVDMESYDVMAAAAQLKIPIVVVRVILDEAMQKTPDFNIGISEDGKMSDAKSAQAMMMRPFAAVNFLLSLRSSMQALRRVSKMVLAGDWDTNF
jgi:nucleoside phosphorylase